MTALTLITDRTQADVDRWRTLRSKGWSAMTAAERTEWAASLKGAYDATDLNRVTAAKEAITEALESYGYDVTYKPVEAATGRTEWLVSDIPTPAQLTAYLANVSTLRAVLELPEATPAVPADMVNLTAEEANDIERILLVIETVITNMTKAWYFSGDLFAGEV